MNEAKLNELLGKMVMELGAAWSGASVIIDDQLGLYLVTFFDALHDMGDPVGAAAHVHSTLKPDGVWMLVEPNAQDDLAGNLNPVGRAFYASSALVCVPDSLSQEVRLALGAQADEAKLRQVVTQDGFTRFRRATETPFNMILEARS